jgi:hypothetical protein
MDDSFDVELRFGVSEPDLFREFTAGLRSNMRVGSGLTVPWSRRRSFKDLLMLKAMIKQYCLTT